MDNVNVLKDYCIRCKMMGVKPYIDDAWLIDIENDEIVLDWTDFWEKGGEIEGTTFSYLNWKSGLGISEDNWLKVPDGITKIRGGVFHNEHRVYKSICLDLNELKELQCLQFHGISWIEHLKGNNIKKIHPSALNHMEYIKRIELESLSSTDLTVEHLKGLPNGCQVYLDDIQTTVSKLKHILFRNQLKSMGRQV